jgi:predicted GNAT family N-acyltransferase
LTEIRYATVVEANALYKDAGYSGRAAPGDLIVAAYRHGELLAVARLIPQSGHALWLRHLCTMPAFRKRGTARALCLWIRNNVRTPVIIFPLPELIPMYQSAGFRITDADHLPAELARHWAQVKRKYPASEVMSSETEQ